MAFNSTRFANFAKYDLTINKTFFTSLSLVTLIGTMAITFVAFTGRYSMWKAATDNPWYDGTPISPFSQEHYNFMPTTCAWIYAFLAIMMIIFAGCWAHNLRNKQGRIIELTLPATNFEKFAWHTLLMIGGGFLTCLVSLLISDLFNLGLTAIFCGVEDGFVSLTCGVGKAMTISSLIQDQINSLSLHVEGLGSDGSTSGSVVIPELAVNFFHALGLLFICSSIMKITFYMLGNALKYKYNIIFTYIATQIIGLIVGIGAIILIGTYANIFMENTMMTLMAEDAGTEATQFFQNITTAFYVIAPIQLILSALFVWLSYNRYTKAQITSPLNK